MPLAQACLPQFDTLLCMVFVVPCLCCSVWLAAYTLRHATTDRVSGLKPDWFVANMLCSTSRTMPNVHCYVLLSLVAHRSCKAYRQLWRAACVYSCMDVCCCCVYALWLGLCEAVRASWLVTCMGLIFAWQPCCMLSPPVYNIFA